MYDVMYGSVTNTHVKENPCMVLIPSSVSKSTGKYCMAEKPSHVSRVSLSHQVEIGIKVLRSLNKEYSMIFEDKVEMLASRKNTKKLHRPKNKVNFQKYGGGNPPQGKFSCIPKK
jgi:hypothetical protein